MARAWLAAFGIPANAPKDAVYLIGLDDADGDPLDTAKHNYVIRFKSEKDLPPAKGFWSLTMYDDQYFFIANPLSRYTLSERNKLKKNADGSIDLYLQKDNPDPEKESNWLPAPDAKFIPCSVCIGRMRRSRRCWTAHGGRRSFGKVEGSSEQSFSTAD
ncbi:hypothetical protein AUC68_01080 [Methyloceanibacter methanicus]|uniref:DUF1214 domain-containing protein n=1 Tax=Methyloceanibacter methanicus TaxID=1774968 RepID=A0A1E3W3F5_9HYPH|nr:DUF1214 domain-containing protein [Methyloceanibacter methanicus]ODS00270.1 hypothetical protein AUC68_01080 [Methyloceanibacter methanicus]